MRKCIFTQYNFQIEPALIHAQAQVINKFRENTDIDFLPLSFNISRDNLIHGQVLDYALPYLFDGYEYDCVLILDVDCIPLSTNALQYTFDQIEKNVFVGCAQRSMHIENNKHVYIGSPCFGLSKSVYNAMNRVSALPNHRGDTIEEFTYVSEEKCIPMEIFMPKSYEKLPLLGKAWELDSPDKTYGIGTTFVNSSNIEMFYHLFETRNFYNNHLFLKKTQSILG